jgi:hypothetical protein
LRLRGLLLSALAVALVIALFTVSPRQLAVTVGVIVLVSLPLAWSVAALLDAARRPEWAWALAGRARVLWMVMVLLGVAILPFGMVVSTWYLLRVRPELRDAEQGRIWER